MVVKEITEDDFLEKELFEIDTKTGAMTLHMEGPGTYYALTLGPMEAAAIMANKVPIEEWIGAPLVCPNCQSPNLRLILDRLAHEEWEFERIFLDGGWKLRPVAIKDTTELDNGATWGLYCMDCETENPIPEGYDLD